MTTYARKAARVAFLLLLIAIAFAGPTLAHRRAASDAVGQGIAIPSMTHGQMEVMADYRGAVVDLAARQQPTDEVFRRLLNYANIQFSYCLWGLAPAAIADEASPFNECSHAYLSAYRALLAHMATMPGAREAVSTLISRIDLDMIRKNASFVLCQYSDEPFNTSELVVPDWTEAAANVLLRPGAVVVMLGLVAGGAFLVIPVARLRRR